MKRCTLLFIRKIKVKTQGNERLAMPNVTKDLDPLEQSGSLEAQSSGVGWRDIDDQGSHESFGGETSVS